MPLHPYIGLRANDTVDSVRLHKAAGEPRSAPFRHYGTIAWIGDTPAMGTPTAHLLQADGTHVALPLARLQVHPDDLPIAAARMRALDDDRVTASNVSTSLSAAEIEALHGHVRRDG